MPDVNMLYMIIGGLIIVVIYKCKLAVPFDNYNCKDIGHNEKEIKMEMYCISTTCPMLNNCKRNRQQTATDYNSYTDYSAQITVGIKGYECDMFIYKVMG